MLNSLIIKKDYVVLNGMYVKTYLIKDYPKNAVAGLLYCITHGKHTEEPGVVINFSIHIKPYNFVYDFWTKKKLDRLQSSISQYNTGRWSDMARGEEIGAAEALLHFARNIGRNRSGEIWFTVTLTAQDEKGLQKYSRRLEEEIEHYSQFKLEKLICEQHTALSAALINSPENILARRYNGRIVDENAIAALYPFMDGSVSNFQGCYIGHRIYDATAVYKDFKKGTDNQNIIVTGLSGSGKSTWIKGLIVSLLIEGFRVYVFDVDGEYYNLCKEVGGVWVDYTAGTGRYVDPTIIEPPIMYEIDTAMLDENAIQRAKESDNARFSEAVANTRALISLLSRDFEKDVERQNALSLALMDMWKDAGILKHKLETWVCEKKDKIGLHILYDRIKTLAKSDEGAKRLQKDLWTYFEGADSDIFVNADDGRWMKDAQLVAFHVAQSADNPIEQHIGAIKIVSTTHMTWQQIKRDRIKGEHFSVEIFDEWQRLSKNKYAKTPVYRSFTTGRKYNDQVILGFNDPAVLFDDPDGESIWNNSKYKIFFRLEENSVRKFAKSANMHDEVVEEWLNLPQHAFIYREMTGAMDAYDVLRMELPPSEISKLSRTRGVR